MTAFQPARKFVDSEAKANLVGDVNKPYFQALLQLGQQVEGAVKTNPSVATDATAFAPITQTALAASGVVDQAGLAFDPDQLTHTSKTFLALLKAPIECVSKNEPSPGGAANGAGQKLCAALSPLLAKYPFNRNSTQQATVHEVDAFFAPQTGALAAAYDGGLNKVLVPSGSRYEQAPTAPGRVNPRFAAYFSNLEHISSVLYPGGAKSATTSFSLRWVPTNEVSNAAIVIDGQRTSGTAEQKFTWMAITAQSASISSESIEAPFQGSWAAFQLVRRAKHITSTGGGYRLEYSFDINLAGVNATTKPVTFELQGPGAEIFAGEALSGLGCVQPVILK
jgi:type VI secretion system protein ImpL